MSNVKMIRYSENSGRIVIPKEILMTCSISSNDAIEFFIDAQKETLSLQKYIGHSCKFCQSTEGLSFFKGTLICTNCRYMLKNRFMNKQALKPKEIMALLLLELHEKYPNASQQEYADMLGISKARVSQLIQKMFDEAGES